MMIHDDPNRTGDEDYRPLASYDRRRAHDEATADDRLDDDDDGLDYGGSLLDDCAAVSTLAANMTAAPPPTLAEFFGALRDVYALKDDGTATAGEG